MLSLAVRPLWLTWSRRDCSRAVTRGWMTGARRSPCGRTRSRPVCTPIPHRLVARRRRVDQPARHRWSTSRRHNRSVDPVRFVRPFRALQRWASELCAGPSGGRPEACQDPTVPKIPSLSRPEALPRRADAHLWGARLQALSAPSACDADVGRLATLSGSILRRPQLRHHMHVRLHSRQQTRLNAGWPLVGLEEGQGLGVLRCSCVASQHAAGSRAALRRPRRH